MREIDWGTYRYVNQCIKESYRKLETHGHRKYEGMGRGDPIPFTLDQYIDLVEGAMQKPCYHCGGVIDVGNLSPDHKRALSKGGTSDITNIRIICRKCNMQKKGRDEDEFRRSKVKIRLARLRESLQ